MLRDEPENHEADKEDKYPDDAPNQGFERGCGRMRFHGRVIRMGFGLSLTD